MIYARSHDHNNSPTPLLLTGWLLLVLFASMVTTINKQLPASYSLYNIDRIFRGLIPNGANFS